MQTALLQKGFREDNKKHHIYFHFYFNGKKTSIFTFFSHGDTEVSGGRINQMGRQVKLIDKVKFLELVDCDMDADAYIKILLEQKDLTPEPPEPVN
jgi:hypothetical protein